MGLIAISLPDTRVNLYELVAKGEHVLGIKWHQNVPNESEKEVHMSNMELPSPKLTILKTLSG